MRRKLKAHQVSLVLAVILIGQLCVTVARAQDISAELSRAQSFYKANQFEESLILLTQLEKRVSSDPQRGPDLVKINLYMGLAHLGLNQTDQAKSRFSEVCKLDSKYMLNPEEYPRNAVALFNEVKATCALPTRPAIQPANPAIADSTFQRGKELYERGEFGDALKYFNVVLALDSGHVLAREYSELAQQRLAIIADRGYLEWSISFEARQFDKAAATYSRILSDQTAGSAQLATQIEGQYGKAVSNLINAWKAACGGREFQKLDGIRNEALNIAPGLPFSRDAVAQMQPCASPATPVNTANPATASKSPEGRVASSPPRPAPASPTPAPSPVAPGKSVTAVPLQDPGECIHPDPRLVMSRLKVRVNPEFGSGLREYVERGIKGIVVSVAIDEKGNVTVKEVTADSRIANALKAAVEQWKFNPTIIDNQPRCVEADIPITLTPR